MNPLAALRLAVSPGVHPEAIGRAAEGFKAIPAAELEKLCGQTEVQGPGAPGAASGTFSTLLGQLVQDVNAKQAAAGQAVNGLLSGQNVTLHQAMIAMEEASVSFQLMVEVRNKLLESYQELMRMQI